VERDSESDCDDGVGKKTRKERAKGFVKKIKGQLLSGDEDPEPLLKSPKEKKKDPVPLIQADTAISIDADEEETAKKEVNWSANAARAEAPLQQQQNARQHQNRLQQQQQQQPSKSQRQPLSPSRNVNVNAEGTNVNRNQDATNDDLDPKTERAMQSYTKWIVFFILAVVLFIASFAPLIYYAVKIEQMEEKVEQDLDKQARETGTAPPPTTGESVTTAAAAIAAAIARR